MYASLTQQKCCRLATLFLQTDRSPRISPTNFFYSHPEQAASTRGLYRITDNFFRFWFSFVFPNLSDLETGDAEGVFDHAVAPELNDFASPVFETVCREFIRGKNRRGELPFRAAKLGRWWGKLTKTVAADDGKSKPFSVDSEIDIVAVDSKSRHYILGECKFRNSKVDIADLEHLKEKSSIVKKGAAVEYALFSKSGFTEGMIARAKEDENVKLFSLPDIVAEHLS